MHIFFLRLWIVEDHGCFWLLKIPAINHYLLMKMKEPCKSFNYGAEIRELELEERRIAIKKAKLEILERELALTERAYALSQKN